MHTACNFTKISTAGITNRNNAQKRQAYTRYAKAEHSPPNVRSGGLTLAAGKIRLPAPKKSANSIEPMAINRLLLGCSISEVQKYL